MSHVRPMDDATRASRLDRSRMLLAANAMTNAAAWRLAREIAATARNGDGWGDEGLRGLWNPAGGRHGTLVTWAADYATHTDGARLLGLPSGPEGAPMRMIRSWEVEINLHRDGTMFLAWHPEASHVADAIMTDPRIGFVEGQLARSGRILVVREHGVRFADRVGLLDDPEAVVSGRNAVEKATYTTLFRRLEETTSRGWNAVRPEDGVLARARAFLCELREMRVRVAPELEITANGEITLEWRGTGHHARIEFRIGGGDAGRMVLDNRAAWAHDSDLDGPMRAVDVSGLLQRFERKPAGVSLRSAMRAR